MLLNRLLWDPQYSSSKDHIIEYVHRVGKDTIVRRVKIRDVREIGSWYFVVNTSSGMKLIPFHRVTRIIASDGRVLWSKTDTSNSKFEGAV